MSDGRLDACADALDKISNRLDAIEARTDPPVSERQRRAMRAAAAGNSNLGISKSVGEEFSEADPGGKLPEVKKDNDNARYRVVALTKAGKQREFTGSAASHYRGLTRSMAEDRMRQYLSMNPASRAEIVEDPTDYGRQAQIARIGRHLSSNKIRMR